MIFVANYKMNGDKNFYQKVNKVFNKLKVEDTIVLCPPFVYMPFLKLKKENVYLGSQDVAGEINKQSTGQISVKMLNDFNVKYSIVGHSERRAIGETDETVAKKVNIAQVNGIIPIVCVGENSKSAGLDIIEKQVKIALLQATKNEIIFAYEPIWAIGSGLQPTISQINEAVKIIKTTAKDAGFDVKILYGGSVNLSNYKEIQKAKIDGLLMGGVSLKLEDFIKIVKGE